MPSSQIAERATLEALSHPTNTIASNLPKESVSAKAPKAKTSKAPVKVAGSYKKGGKVKKTAVYKLHKGERVLNPKQTKKAEKSSALTAVLSE